VRSPSSVVRHCLLLAGLAAAAVVLEPDAGAQDGASCPPGGPTPTLRAQDRQAGAGGTLTATHDIDVETDFPDGSSPDVQFSAPAGVHVRAIARAKLPSASMPFKRVTASLRDLEPGIDRQRYLRGPRWQITARTNFPHTALFVEAGVKTGSAHDHPLGLEFQALQAGRPMIRVRAAGKCNFGGCTWRIFKVQAGT
jgi:hypothetical protein